MGSLSQNVHQFVSFAQDPGDFPGYVDVVHVLVGFVGGVGGASGFLGETPVALGLVAWLNLNYRILVAIGRSESTGMHL